MVGVLVRRGADFASAEDAVQSALVRALEVWPHDPPHNPQGWLVTTAWRKFIDRCAAMARGQPGRSGSPGNRSPTTSPCATTRCGCISCARHPLLTPSSAIALTLRAVAGLTTRQIADAYLVPEATMAQRISRAKQRIAGVRLDRPGDVTTVLRVLYLLFNEGYSGDIDLAAEAIRVTRQLAALRRRTRGAGAARPDAAASRSSRGAGDALRPARAARRAEPRLVEQAR